YIGTDVTGTAAVGNGIGVDLAGGNMVNTTVGGTDAGARNVISGNRTGLLSFGGLFIGLKIQGNYIGIDATGTKALGNAVGMALNGPNMMVGGPEPGAGNVISGNMVYGILIQNSTGITVQGNFIGTDATGTTAVGNTTGVQIGAFGSN